MVCGPPCMGLNALKSLRRQAFGERSEDFHGAESREGNGIGKAVGKVHLDLPDSLGGPKMQMHFAAGLLSAHVWGVTPAQSKIMVEK